MKRIAAAAVLGLLLAACASGGGGAGAPRAPTGTARVPSGRIELGDWARGAEAQVRRGFADTIAARYGVGLALSAATADLRANEFTCASNRDHRGDPPDMACRRSISAGGCIHTWQVHLYDDRGSQALARTRALYDRTCSRDELLGGRERPQPRH